MNLTTYQEKLSAHHKQTGEPGELAAAGLAQWQLLMKLSLSSEIL